MSATYSPCWRSIFSIRSGVARPPRRKSSTKGGDDEIVHVLEALLLEVFEAEEFVESIERADATESSDSVDSERASPFPAAVVGDALRIALGDGMGGVVSDSDVAGDSG